MIQRLQSLWLLIAAVFAVLSFNFPFYSGTVPEGEAGVGVKYAKLTASYHLLILVLTGAILLGCLIIIFLYKDRKLQLRLTILTLAISLINIILYFMQKSKFVNGDLSFAAIFVFAIPVLLFFAARGIWKDEKLIKSLDRLR